MSTILKTLKKLEEEKSLHRQKGDLKEMVLQGEESDILHSSSVGLENWIWIAGGNVELVTAWLLSRVL